MIIGGFLPTTLLDYPEKLACTVFTCGCNFRCPFCQNGTLVLGARLDSSDALNTSVPKDTVREALSAAPEYEQSEDILERIKKRKNILEGVCITGGEPTLQKDLPDFLRKIKSLGLLIKLDTNGSRPDVIKALHQEGLIDYVAMDIKSSRENYPVVSGIPGLSVATIEKSAEFLIHCGIEYEFRTTLVKGLHTPADMEAIATWLNGAKKYYLQSYEDSELILCKLMSSGITLGTFSAEELQQFLRIARTTIPSAALRGI